MTGILSNRQKRSPLEWIRRAVLQALPPHKATPHRRAGMTLIEVVVATAILGFGLAAVYVAIGASMQARKQAHDYYLGALLANNALEEARATAFSDLAALNTVSAIAIDENGVPDSSGRFRKSLTIEASYNGNPSVVKITSTIGVPRARSQGQWGNVSVSTLLIDIF